MPNEFNALQPGNETFNELIGGAEASSIAPPEVVAARRSRRANWNTRGLNEKLMAAARSTVNNFPVLGETLSPSTQPDVQEFRENMPLASLGTNIVGGGIPLVGQAARAAQPMFRQAFGTIPRAMGSSAVIGGADAASRGENTAQGAGMAALTAGILGALGKGITPRSDTTRFNINRDAKAAEFAAARNELAAASNRRKTPATSVDRLPQNARDRIAAAGQPNVPQIPEFGELPMWAQSGIGFAGGLGMSRGHPGMAAIGALAAPILNSGARASRNKINRMIASAGGRRYMNNNVLNDRLRTILHSSGIALTPDETMRNNDGPMTQQQILDFLGNAAQ